MSPQQGEHEAQSTDEPTGRSRGHRITLCSGDNKTRAKATTKTTTFLTKKKAKCERLWTLPFGAAVAAYTLFGRAGDYLLDTQQVGRERLAAGVLAFLLCLRNRSRSLTLSLGSHFLIADPGMRS